MISSGYATCVTAHVTYAKECFSCCPYRSASPRTRGRSLAQQHLLAISLNLTARAEYNNRTFTCHVSFEKEDQFSEPMFVGEPPEYTDTCTTTFLVHSKYHYIPRISSQSRCLRANPPSIQTPVPPHSWCTVSIITYRGSVPRTAV